MPSVLILMCGAFLISSPLSPFPTIAFSFRFSYTVYRAFTVFSGFFHQIIRIIGSMKATIEAIRLPIESHSGKSGCRSSKLSRYPGLSFSKFLISSFESSLPTYTMVIFSSFFFFIFAHLSYEFKHRTAKAMIETTNATYGK